MLHTSTRLCSGGHRPSSADPAFRRDVLNGLAARPRTIPPRWFYDRDGSALFEEITTLPEYYLTRTERALLQSAAAEIASLVGPGRAVVEFGSGSSSKTPILLTALNPAAYVPIDIAGDFFGNRRRHFRQCFAACQCTPSRGISRMRTASTDGRAAPRVGFFPGSTIGNLLVPDAVDLLRSMAATLAGWFDAADRHRPHQGQNILLPAYDDRGVTAAFNRNLLHRINSELGGSFPVDAFRHLARWNDEEARIEMHLRAERDVEFEVDDHFFRMAEGETIHTENSLKYGARDARGPPSSGRLVAYRRRGRIEQELFTVILAQETAIQSGACDRPRSERVRSERQQALVAP